MISYDPDSIPEPPPELFRFAETYRLHVVNIICDEPDAEVGDSECVSFAAAVSFLPRSGDMIILNDGTNCEVKRTYFKTITKVGASGSADRIMLFPTVFAERIPPRGEAHNG